MKSSTIIDLAKWAEKKTRELVPYSSNENDQGPSIKKDILLNLIRKQKTPYFKQLYHWNLNPENLTWEEGELLTTRKVSLQENRSTMILLSLELDDLDSIHKKKQHKDGSEVTELERLENIAKNSVRHHIGNCGEVSAVAFNLLLEHSPLSAPVKVERVAIIGRGDHAFLILNRDAGSNLKKLDTFGDEAVICDPWKRESVRIKEQLALPEKERSWIINHFLRYGKNIKICNTGYVGNGHSNRWLNKHGSNFFSEAKYERREENIPFVDSSIKSNPRF